MALFLLARRPTRSPVRTPSIVAFAALVLAPLGACSSGATPDAAVTDGAADDAPQATDAGPGADTVVAPEYRFAQLSGVQSPFVGRWGFAVADRGDGTAVVFAGADFDAGGGGGSFNEPYLLDARGASPVFTRIDAPAPPGARWCTCATYDSQRDHVVVFGGRNISGALTPETWILDLAHGGAASWTRVTSAASPTFAIGCAMAYVPGRDAVYLFGGGSESAVTNQTWRFDPAAATWTQVMATPGPSSRYDAELRYVPASSGLVLFGGGRPGTFPTDLWRFDPVSERWSEVTVTGARPPGRRTPWVRVRPDGSALVAGYGATTLQGGEPLSDLWQFDFASGTWQDVTPPLAAIPAPRGFALSLPAGSGHVGLMVGGFDGLRPQAEVWRVDAPVGDARW